MVILSCLLFFPPLLLKFDIRKDKNKPGRNAIKLDFSFPLKVGNFGSTQHIPLTLTATIFHS